jgi:hypothetical protein
MVFPPQLVELAVKVNVPVPLLYAPFAALFDVNVSVVGTPGTVVKVKGITEFTVGSGVRAQVVFIPVEVPLEVSVTDCWVVFGLVLIGKIT